MIPMRKKIWFFLNRKVKLPVVLTALSIVCWAIYSFKFSRFYKDVYFYVDKRMPLEYKIIFYFSEEWVKSIIYLVIFLCLSVVTMLVIMYVYYGSSKLLLISLCISIAIIILILFKTLWCVLFVVELLLAFSIFYIIYILTVKKDSDSESLEED